MVFNHDFKCDDKVVKCGQFYQAAQQMQFKCIRK